MSLTFKTITLRNFLSVGAVSQAVNFDTQQLTLVLGENLDMGGADSRNGVGKTTLIQALCYVLFGSSINKIRKDNLINRTNAKNMMVSLEFTANSINYKIERGRKPNVLRFYVNDVIFTNKTDEDDNNTAQGENKETQLAIEHAIGMSSDMFKHIIALNTYVEPFLAMGTNEQRNIIEQLLGITLLSEKAEKVKEQLRLNKESIQQEEFKNKAYEEANKRVQEQIDNLKRRQRLWKKQHEESLTKLVAEYDDLRKINIEHELLSHKELVLWNERKRQYDDHVAIVARQTAWLQKRESDVDSLRLLYDNLSHVDIEAELKAHRDIKEYVTNKAKLELIEKTIKRLESDLIKETSQINKLKSEIETLEANRCYACGQDFHDESHMNVLNSKKELLLKAEEDFSQTKNELEKNKNSKFDLGKLPSTYYDAEEDAIRHSSEMDRIKNLIDAKMSEEDPYVEQLSEWNADFILGDKPDTHYDNETEAVEHKSVLSSLYSQIDIKSNEEDPYNEQILEMENKALQVITFDKINELSKFGDHLKFLYDLLTSKDSFVRKKIVDQNLSYLNTRLTHYLDKIGLPHSVVFKNDLSVEITELGRELDFYNLSRGEMNRLILGLSFAFRDVWENLYFPINALFIDELIDSGMDSVGVENSIAILKELSRTRNKAIWLVSHRDELSGRVPSILRVIKEGGFTSFDTSTEVE